MTTPKPMRGHLNNEEVWEARKRQLRERTAENVERLGGGEVPEVVEHNPPEPEEPPLDITALACGEDCPECHGVGYTIDHTDSPMECSRYRARIRKANGGGDD